MNLETWLLFAAAAALVLVIPGPTAVLLLCRSLAHGRRATVPLVAGVTAGDCAAMSCSLLGMGALLAASAAWFALFKWAGAVYLIYLGVKTWREPLPALRADDAPAPRAAAFFREAFTVTALNPKSILFFVAFLPQFVVPGAPALPQLFALGATFLILAAANATMYSAFSASIRGFLTRPAVRRALRISGGSALAGAGVVAATLQRPAH